MKNAATAGLIKIGELAKATNTSVSTLKFYVKEGLIQPACKTGTNMAYYGADCIARVQLIKSLQKEHYYPLSVIKRVLENSDSQLELKFLDAIHKVDYSSSSRTYSLTEAAKMSRLTKEQIGMLSESGLIKPQFSGKRQRYTDEDLQLMMLLRRRMDAGIPFAQSILAFQVYDRGLCDAAKADVDLFIRGALLVVRPSAKDAVRMVCVSDETLDAFISKKRAAYNRAYGSERLGDLDRFAVSLCRLLEEIGHALCERGYTDLAKRCEAALSVCPAGEDDVSEALRHCHMLLSTCAESLSTVIDICGRIHGYYIALDPESAQGAEAVLLYSLRLCWLSLAPELLDCGGEARAAQSGFEDFVSRQKIKSPAGYSKKILSAIKQTGGTI